MDILDMGSVLHPKKGGVILDAIWDYFGRLFIIIFTTKFDFKGGD
jgi:hypothetical protein